MKRAHKEAQNQFEQIGISRGFKVKKIFTREIPTDGVWFYKEKIVDLSLPIVALEVAVSESAKLLKGSLMTLQEVSPSLGILVLHDKEMRRKVIRNGGNMAKVETYFQNALNAAHRAKYNLSQRIEIMSATQLEYVFEFETRKCSKALGKQKLFAA